MERLLNELFDGAYRPGEPRGDIPSLEKACRVYDEDLAAVLERLDGETRAKLGELLDRRGAVAREEGRNAYAEGVRFGVRLVTEAFAEK